MVMLKREWLCLGFLGLCLVSSGQTILFKNFYIADGTGSKLFLGDVRIRDNKIAILGELIPRPGEKVIDGQNRKVLAPGFIDTHSHHDRNLEDSGQYSSFLNQGITTLVIGQDGSSRFPLQDYFEQLTRERIPVNLASYSGHNTLRFNAMGNTEFNREATHGEIRKMKKGLKQDLKSGALGLSTGLEYDPGIFSSKDEVLKLALTAARKDGRYASHLRSEDVGLEEALTEIIDIGRRTRMPVHISHFKIAMKAKWGKADQLLQRLDSAQTAGVQITADVYPYDFWLSTLEVHFPKRDFDNRQTAEFALRELTPPDGLILSRYDARPDLVGKSIAQIAEDWKQDPAEVYIQLIKTARDKNAPEHVMGRSMHENDITRLMQWKHTNICSDGFGGGRHPRGVASFPRVLHYFSGQLKAFEFETAIHKMTLLSADHMGLALRGKISPGFYADLVVMDRDQIKDHASLEDPYALSSGIEQVWVNGVQVWDGRSFMGSRPGMVLKRQAQ